MWRRRVLDTRLFASVDSGLVYPQLAAEWQRHKSPPADHTWCGWRRGGVVVLGGVACRECTTTAGSARMRVHTTPQHMLMFSRPSHTSNGVNARTHAHTHT